MTNVDVVRMVAANRPEADILRAIRTAADTDFDLDPDTVTELRRAGVADVIIEAMRAVTRTVVSPNIAPAPATGELEVLFENEEGDDVLRRTAVMPAKDWNDRPVTLGFYLYCLDPLHVPDLWDTKTPLAGSAPRHHLLWFHSDTRPVGEGRRPTVYLALPASHRLPLQAGAHPLELGVVGRAGDMPWAAIASAAKTLTIEPGKLSRLVVRVRTTRPGVMGLATGGRPSITCEILRVEPTPTEKAPDPN